MKLDEKDVYVLELSAEAYDDLLNIQNYTFLHFGEVQWNKYSSLLDEAFSFLSEHPFGGSQREDLPLGYQAWKVGEHIIVYRIEGTIIYIVRVLHGRMNFRYKF